MAYLSLIQNKIRQFTILVHALTEMKRDPNSVNCCQSSLCSSVVIDTTESNATFLLLENHGECGTTDASIRNLFPII